MQKPAFLAFTGVDRMELLPQMQTLSRLYPIEWGVLVRPGGAPDALFPPDEVCAAILAAGGLRLAAHVCGEAALEIAERGDTTVFNPAGHQRVQVNHGFCGSTPAQASRVRDYGRRHGVRSVLQTRGYFPSESGVDWLFDVSFGAGKRPDHWPALPPNGPFCGFSGGLGPDTIAETLAEIAPAEGVFYWLDMESGVRTDGWPDLEKCRAVCEQVYG